MPYQHFGLVNSTPQSAGTAPVRGDWPGPCLDDFGLPLPVADG
jgi:hypothetical protein